ncbi:MAG TPA: type I-E CRISPR-associated endoribonuclease Cas2e [Armatimonadota bacterium]|nr:type I-E CRISPR-associated endoribonuclease Cas2e [Armatimonadota bacterium]
MVVLVIEHVPTSLRGQLSRWMIEPRAGLFVGNVSAMVREKLWEYLLKEAPDGGLMMLYNAKTEQGFTIRTSGDTTRKVIDLEGLTLIQHPSSERTKRC